MIFQFLGILDRVLFLSIKNGKFYYSYNNLSVSYFGTYNKTSKNYKLGMQQKYKSKQDILSNLISQSFDIVVLSETPSILPMMTIEIPIKYVKDSIELHGKGYTPDGLFLSSFNYDQCNAGHGIAGVTCKGKRYLYNGWRSKINSSIIKLFQKSHAIFSHLIG